MKIPHLYLGNYHGNVLLFFDILFNCKTNNYCTLDLRFTPGIHTYYEMLELYVTISNQIIQLRYRQSRLHVKINIVII